MVVEIAVYCVLCIVCVHPMNWVYMHACLLMGQLDQCTHVSSWSVLFRAMDVYS